MKIVFMGTPEFAVASLQILVENGYNIVGVITAPDRPAGRGQKLKPSAVKEYAQSVGLKILQPTNLKDPEFLTELSALQADLQIVVAFRMLPESVWNMPPKGTFNLHASLLPNYRGAAPINWAVINGEKETGVTTFFLQHEIDTGNILFQEKIKIAPDENVGVVHDKLMKLGAELVLKTTAAIESGNYMETPQNELMDESVKPAPKIFKETCEIDWNNDTVAIYNFIRGLSPYPGAWFKVNDNDQEKIIKVFESKPEYDNQSHQPGEVLTDNSHYLKVATKDGYIHIHQLQLPGKKRMHIEELLRGYSFSFIN